MPDREDYLDLVERQSAAHTNGQRTNLEMIRQAAVKMDLLTGDQCWDTFLTYLEAAAEALTVQRETTNRTLCGPQTVDPNDIMVLKFRIAQLDVQIATIRGIMALPKDIRESGDKAEDLLSRLG